jgi:hypothetical protein
MKTLIFLLFVCLTLSACASHSITRPINFTLVYYPEGVFHGDIYKCHGDLQTKWLATSQGIYEGIITNVRSVRPGDLSSYAMKGGWFDFLTNDGYVISIQGWTSLDGENTVAIITPSPKAIQSLIGGLVPWRKP